MKLTNVVEDFVTLVENEHLEVFEVERLVLGQMKDTSWSSNDNVRRLWALEQLLLFLEGLTTQNNFSPDIPNELGQTCKFTLDLIGELSRVGKNKHTCRLWALTNAM